jgi:acyl-CoA thioester hydrolase
MRFFRKTEVRFRDLDGLNHVNNAVYHSYVEQARVDYFDTVIGTRHDWTSFGVLLARTEIDYNMPVYLKEDVRTGIQVTRLGTKSIELSFVIEKKLNDQFVTACKGTNVLVCFDHKTQVTAQIPENWRNAFGSFENL